MKNRKLLLAVSLLLALTMSLGGTLAYLTDTDSDVNVMTLGNVKIEQIELQRAEGVDYNATADEGDLVPFKQGQKLYPAYPETNPVDDYQAAGPQDDCFKWGPYVTADVQGTAWNGLFDDTKLNGAMDKFVFVKNTGTSPAYYRTWLAFECPESLTFSKNDVAAADLWLNVNGNETYFKWDGTGYAYIDGVRYLVMSATYLKELPAGEISRPSLLQVVLTHTADSEDMEKLGSTYEILTFTQAVQTENMPDAVTALNEAFGPAYNADGTPNHPWTDGSPVVPQPGSDNYLSEEDAQKLLESLESGTTIVAEQNKEFMLNIADGTDLDCNDSLVVLNSTGTASGNYGYLAFVAGAGNSATISNLTVAGSGFVELGDYDAKGGTYVANNLVIRDLNATYHVNGAGHLVAPAFGHLGTNTTLNNCVMTGTTTTFDGYTAYDAGFPNGTNTIINGGEYGSIYLWSQAHVTINNAEIGLIDSTAITTGNLGMLTIGAGTHVGTINLIPDSRYLPAITIEDGATVDVITYNGVSYTQNQWATVTP